MARVDKTDSAVGVTRALLAADIASTEYDKVLGVSIDSAGKVVVGVGQTAIIGVVIPNKYNSKAGMPIDIFKLGEIVDCDGLAAGTNYYAVAATGVLTATASGNTKVGFTVEADRLVLNGF